MCLAFRSFHPLQCRHHQDLKPSFLLTTILFELSEEGCEETGGGGSLSDLSGFRVLGSRFNEEDVGCCFSTLIECLSSLFLRSGAVRMVVVVVVWGCGLFNATTTVTLSQELLKSSSHSSFSGSSAFCPPDLLGESSYFLLVSSFDRSFCLSFWSLEEESGYFLRNGLVVTVSLLSLKESCLSMFDVGSVVIGMVLRSVGMTKGWLQVGTYSYKGL